MKILDIYILKRYLIAYVFCVGMLVAVLLVIDFAEKIEDFAHPELTTWRIIREYYLNFIPHYANMLSPLMSFIAAVFVTAKMATHTEIIAILSSGISLKRILLPYFGGSILIALMVFYLYNYVVPAGNKVRHNFENNYVRDKFYFTERNVHIQIAPKLYVYIESYDNIIHTGYRFTIEEIDGLALKSKLEAPFIKWVKEKKRWNLPNYKKREFNGDKEKISYGNSVDTLLALKPKDFESKHKLEEQLTLTELNEYIAQSRLRGANDVEQYEIEKYKRLAYPFAIIILTCIGVVVAAKKSREGTGFQIAFGFVLAFIYILLLVISESIAAGGSIPPYVSVWIPNVLFCLMGWVMYKRVPK